MQSNAINHGSYIDVSLSDKIFDVIDFYYFEIALFIAIIVFCLFFLYQFFKSKDENLDIFFPVICSMLISLLYLFFFVNKTWSGYYVSSIYLCVLAFIPFFIRFHSKKLLALMLLLQMGG